MGLYDNYKQSNSQYISQYVGNLVPELADFSQALKKRYNDARDTDDAIAEAMGNLQHLDTEEDTTYANELKQKYINRLDERASREDYENMGRRTQRDARAFSSDYVPLVNRMKGMQAIQERVLQDDKIFDPEKKQQILGHIKRLNAAEKDATTGDFQRDAAGRVKLGSIQDWAYAKDVDINKKLAEFIKMKEANMKQSGFSPDGRGLMISHKSETLSKQEIAVMAKEMMATDPEIRAMVERDVTLATSGMSSGLFSELADKANVSEYDLLARQKLSESQIKTNLAARGLSVEEAKVKPLDRYIAQGRSPQEAAAAFVKDQVRKEITYPHVDLVANLLKVDRHTIEAREDSVMAARITAAAITSAAELAQAGQATPLQIMPDNITAIDGSAIQNVAVSSAKASEEVRSKLQTAVGSYLGLPKPTGKTTTQWEGATGRYLNDKKAQGELIQKLISQGKHQEAKNLTHAFQQYNTLNNNAILARQQLQSLNKGVNFNQLYAQYKKAPGDKKMSLEAFKQQLTNTPITKRSFLGAESYAREDEGIMDRMFNTKTDMAMRMAMNSYGEALQTQAKSGGGSARTKNTVFEPTSSGYLRDQTQMVQDGFLSGLVKGTDMATGRPIRDIIDESLGGTGWFGKVSAEDKKDPNSAYSKAMRGLVVRINMDTRGANGEATASVMIPGGGTRTVTLDNVSPNLPTEMAARMMTSAGKYMTATEARTVMQAAAQGVGYSQLRSMNQVDLYNLRPSSQPYQLNETYYLKVAEAGVKGVGSTNVYTLMVKNGNKMVPTRVVNRTQLGDIIQQIGGEKIQQEMSTIPSQSILNR